MVNSHALISNYLQIDQETISRRDDSSSRHVSNQKFLYLFDTERQNIGRLINKCMVIKYFKLLLRPMNK
jgi:hypothetical protein